MTETNPIVAPAFSTDLQFCPVCGSVLPLPSVGSDVIPCQRCPFKRNIKEYENVVEEFVIHFNTPKKKKKKQKDSKDSEENVTTVTEVENLGPTVERECPRCHNDVMTYTTRQTRSADEGQTVFYTCTKCKFQDIEYS